MTLAEVISWNPAQCNRGIGCFAFAWVDDWIGSRRTILLALAGLITTTAIVVLTMDRTWFYVAGAALGLFVGPAQAASHSLMAHLTPTGRETEFFGLFALSGKATAFLGPALVGGVTAITANQRIGVASLLIPLIAGAALLIRVKEDGAREAPFRERSFNR